MYNASQIFFFNCGNKRFLEAAYPGYVPIVFYVYEEVFQGKLLAVWRKV